MGHLMPLLSPLKKFYRDCDGTTSVEYGVMLALILVTMIIAITAAGSGVADWWNNIDSELDTHGISAAHRLSTSTTVA